MTYSIIARDPTTGQMGIAVQSRYFGVGRVVPWAEAGVGVVATQSFANPSYGLLGLDGLRQGASAAEVVARLRADDPGAPLRQVAILTAHGDVAAHTGAACVAAAGHVIGQQGAAQANMMTRDTVWPAMWQTFEQTTGELADRLLAACDAAEAEGGDLRGSQGAALLVVSSQASRQHGTDRLVDLRIDDHVEPVAELRRHLAFSRSLGRAERATERALAGELNGALVDLEQCCHEFPAEPEFAFRRGLVLLGLGRIEDSQAVFHTLYRTHPAWIELAVRFSQAGIVPIEPRQLRGLLQPPTPG